MELSTACQLRSFYRQTAVRKFNGRAIHGNPNQKSMPDIREFDKAIFPHHLIGQRRRVKDTG